MQRPRGVVKMRSAQRAQVGTAGKDDAVHVVVAADRPDRDRGDPGHVPDPVRERSLVAAAEAGLLLCDGLARRDVNRIDSVGGESARNLDRIVGAEPALVPVHR